MNMIDVMKRLAELDAKNPNRVKETKDNNQKGNFLDRYSDQDRKDIEAASDDALKMKVTKSDEKKSFKDLMKLANQIAPMKKDKKGVSEGLLNEFAQGDFNGSFNDDMSFATKLAIIAAGANLSSGQITAPEDLKKLLKLPGWTREMVIEWRSLTDDEMEELVDDVANELYRITDGRPEPDYPDYKGGVAEAKADPTGSWVVYNSTDTAKFKRFKTREGAKAYAEKNGGTVASSEHYHDTIKKKDVAEGNDPNYQYSDDYSEWKRHHDINNSQRISNPPTPKSSKYPANSREDLEDRLASAKERLAMLNPDRPADRSSFADYKYVIANLERALANMNNVSEEGNADQVYENPTGSTNPKDYDFTEEIVNPEYDDSVEYADDDPIEYYIDVGVNIGEVSGSIVPARVKYDDYDHPDESDLEVEFQVHNLATGEDITQLLADKNPTEYEEISNRAYEMAMKNREDDFDEPYDDPGDPYEPYEESAQDDLTLESIRMLSGIKKTIAECGIGEMSMTGAPSVPASINITAANGPELSNMLKDIMSLAGLHKVEPEHLGLEREPTVISAAPSMSTVDTGSDTMDMRSMISKIDSLNPMDDEAGDEDEEDMELEELAPVQGNTPANPTKVPSMKADAMINKGMHNQDQSGNPEAGDRMDGTMPKAFPAYESLMKEYQAFIKG